MKKRDDLYLLEIEFRMLRIAKYLKNVNRSKFLKSDFHQSAIVRELEVIGEAANRISPEVRARLELIPWREIIGMRNRLIHGYFDVDHSIVWEVAKNELPKLLTPIRSAILDTAPPLHRWRVCPSGFYYVKPHPRQVKVSLKNPDGDTAVREHCRRNPSGKDQLYPSEMDEILVVAKGQLAELGKVGQLHDVPNANDFDAEILVWTSYWNEVLRPEVKLDPNIVKALLASESTFRVDVRPVHIRGKNYARGLFQISDETRRVLADESGELKDHFFTLTANDVKSPNYAAAASIRWLFRKRETASSFSGRPATWEEAVYEYKGYLRQKKKRSQQKGAVKFDEWLALIRKEGEKS